MKATVTIDEAGGVVLPKVVRDELELRDGDASEVVISEHEITLRPVRAKPGT
jgi:AbrB family looped-hinge helix DNA binding protein